METRRQEREDAACCSIHEAEVSTHRIVDDGIDHLVATHGVGKKRRAFGGGHWAGEGLGQVQHWLQASHGQSLKVHATTGCRTNIGLYRQSLEAIVAGHAYGVHDMRIDPVLQKKKKCKTQYNHKRSHITHTYTVTSMNANNADAWISTEISSEKIFYLYETSKC
jgi:hypothetical protein